MEPKPTSVIRPIEAPPSDRKRGGGHHAVGEVAGATREIHVDHDALLAKMSRMVADFKSQSEKINNVRIRIALKTAPPTSGFWWRSGLAWRYCRWTAPHPPSEFNYLAEPG